MFDLILMMKDIYINYKLNPLTKFTSSSRSTEFKEIFPWNISQMITKTIPISMRIVISYAMKWGIKWKITPHTEQECHESLIQGKIHIHQNSNKGL